MELRTAIKIDERRGTITHSDATVLLGSCFSDNIGARMRTAMMNVDVNAFGPIYNPLSIATNLQRAIDGTPLMGDDVFLAGGMWNSFLFHSKMSRSNKLRALEGMNRRIASCHEHLLNARTLIVTLGTAMVYRHRPTGCVVSNCHKLPGHEFARSMASIDDMTDALHRTFNNLLKLNSGINIIITVSPIRHIADGLSQNSLSKAMLRVVADNLVRLMPDKIVYFPSYEIVMDDLRDYRFYAADMVHPSDVAVEYIWQAFQATFFDDRTSQAVARCERVSKRLSHRHITDNAEAIARFDADTRAVVANLIKEYPYIASHPAIKAAIMI
ncbi:MAG: GSCFA domain-containing protein [Muribaculaceae bacterium]